tara:strand:+ start:3961 stop:5784 length:1824 start_codon:yes stop_codon:yes gene_type:complete
LEKDEKAQTEMSYIVLSPTRELAQQTHSAFNTIGKKANIKATCIIGGESIEKQKKLIKAGTQVLVATPGRICDLIKQKIANLDNCKAIVFDEADRLFDMGFKKDIEFILGKAPNDRQLIMVSATSNREILRTAYKFNSHPEELILNSDSLLVDHIQHKVAMVSTEEKFPLLVKTLRDKEDAYAIVFCNTQVQTHTVAEWLIKMGLKAKPISGRLSQNKRTKLLQDFRAKEVTILVCTDVAARGLDFKEINLVINYDLPQEAANYVHRIGRTGRAGAEGEAISFCAHEDCEYIEPIKELIEADIQTLHLEDEDFADDICPKPRIDRKTLSLRTDNRDSKKRDMKQQRPPRPKKTISKNQPEQKRDSQKSATQEDRPPREKKKHTGPRVDRRSIEFTGSSPEQFTSQVLNHFRIADKDLIQSELIKEGKKQFILFGPRKNTYKFTVKPIYKKLLLPFLIEIMKLSQLKLFITVAFRDEVLTVSFKGEDEGLLKRDRNELLKAFEQLIMTYLQTRVYLKREFKLVVKGGKSKVQNQRKPSRDDQDLEKKMKKLAASKRKTLLSKKEPITLNSLNPKERRLIHQFFQDDKEVNTVSIGDGRLKDIQLVIQD